ncbi:unnamed protein product, partial [Amoebophrya sp. A25]
AKAEAAAAEEQEQGAGGVKGKVAQYMSIIEKKVASIGGIMASEPLTMKHVIDPTDHAARITLD